MLRFSRSLAATVAWVVSVAAAGFSGALAQTALSISELPDGNLELRWIDPGSELTLESAAGLTLPIDWLSEGLTPSASGDERTAILSPSATTRFFRLAGEGALGPARIVETSPADEETGVSVNRETIFRFDRPLAPETLLTPALVAARGAGRVLLTRMELATDRRSAALFYLEPIPSSTRVTVRFDGFGVLDAAGRALDADADGWPGGVREVHFTTVNATPIGDTAILGRVFASEKNPDGTDRPLAGVTISVDGAEQTLRTITGADGSFRLQPAPAGRFFVHVDGRTSPSSQWPDGAYYPFVGKAWETVPGRTNNLANGDGLIYLPLVPVDALVPVSAFETTVVGFAPSLLATNPALAGVEVRVPSNALFSDAGTRGGRVGIVPVAPDRLPEPLPPGLRFALVITIQTDGPSNFDRPAPVRFPNLPDPVTGLKLPPGAKTALWSFNHDTGRWEIQGPMTITADGNFAETDPGVGVLQPGWHGPAPGSGGGGPTGNQDDDDDDEEEDCKDANANGVCDNQDDDPCELAKLQAIFAATDFFTGAVGLIPDVEGALPNCALAATTAALQGIRDCGVDPSGCRTTVGLKLADFAIGCAANFTGNLKPVVDGAVFLKGVLDSGLAYATYLDCRELNQTALTRHGPRPAGVARGNPFLLQYELEVRLGALMDATYGLGWRNLIMRDGPKFAGLVEAIHQATAPGSPGGSALTAEERAGILAQPHPEGVDLAQVDALVTRMTRLLAGEDPGGFDTAAIELALEQLEAVLQDLVAEGWNHTHEGYARGLAILQSLIASSGQRVGGGAARQDASPAADPPYLPGLANRRHAWWLLDLNTGFVRRGQLNAAGNFEGLILAPETDYLVAYADPVTGRAGVSAFRSRTSGRITSIPGAVLAGPPTAADRDADGLSDFAELVVGTNPDLPDTDGDGLKDGAEFTGGGNPLDNQPLDVGLVAQRPTDNRAMAVTTSDDLALVATRSGFAVFNVRDPLDPLPLSQLTFGGTAVTAIAAVDGRALVPTNNGVRFFELGDGRAPASLGAVTTGLTPVTLAAAGRLAFAPGRVGTTNTIAIFAHDRPLLLDQVPLPADSGSLQQLRIEGDRLWALAWSSPRATLLPYRILGRGLEPLGALVLPDLRLTAGQTGPDLAVAPGRAYVSDARQLHVIDTSDPALPTVLNSSPTGTTGAFRDLALNGTGLLLASQVADFSLYSVAADKATNFLFSVPVPDDLLGLTHHRGYALTAMNFAGLGVIHFLSPDTGLVPPAITLQAHVSEPPTRQEENALFALTTVTDDDVQLRTVEFFVDDQPTAFAGGFPFSATIRAPASAPGKTSFTVRARATDTGGNQAWSDALTLQLTPDATPPAVELFQPAAGADLLPGQLVTVVVGFSEPGDPLSFAAGLRITEAGPDGVHGTSDDQAISPVLAYQAGLLHAELRIAPAFPSGAYQLTANTNLLDASGIALEFPRTWTFRVRSPAVTASTPANNSQHRPGSPARITTGFSVLMDADSLREGGFLLHHAGPDAQPDTADDIPVNLAALRFSSLSNLMEFVPDPPLPSGRYRARFTTNALDTLGNRLGAPPAWSFRVLSPLFIAADPPDGHARPLGSLTELRLHSTDPLDPATLASGLQLALTNGTPVGIASASFEPGTLTATLAFPSPLPGGDYVVRATPAVTDVYGNPLGAEFVSRFAVHGPVTWAVDADGRWNEAAKWSPARPIPGDDVVIDRPADVFTVNHTTGNTWVNRLTVHDNLSLTGGSLTIESNSLISGELRVDGATVSNRADLRLTGSLSLGSAARVRGDGLLQIVGPARLEGGTLANAIRFEGQRIHVETGPLTWATGDLGTSTTSNATWVIGPGGTLEAVASTTRRSWQDNRATLWNQGILRQSGGTNTLRWLNLSVTNDGLWDITAGHAELHGSLHQQGRLVVAAGSSLRLYDDNDTRTVNLTPSGVIEGPGSLILDRTDTLFAGRYAVTGGTRVESAAVTFAGELALGDGAIALVNSTVAFDNGPLSLTGPLIFTGGTLDFHHPTTLAAFRWEFGRVRAGGDLSVNGFLRVGSDTVGNDSQFAGPGWLRVNDGMDLRRSFTLEPDAVFEHAGSTVWSPASTAARLTLDDGSIFRNLPNGRFEIATNRVITGRGTFENRGLLVKSANGLTNDLATPLEHTGTLEVAGGRLRLSAGGTLGGIVNLAAGATLDISGANLRPGWILSAAFTGPGTLLLRGASNAFTGTLTGPSLILSNSPTVRLPAQFAATDLAVYGGQVLFDNQLRLTGSNTLLSGRETRFEGPGLLRNDGHVTSRTAWFACPIENAGDWLHLSSSRPRFAALFRNLPGATFTLTNSSSGTTPEPTTGVFDNAGVFRKDGSNSAILPLPLTNRGALVLTGSLSLPFGFTQTAEGVTRLGGGTLRFGNGSDPLLQGVIIGPGLMAATVADFFVLTNAAATLRPSESGYGQLTLGGTSADLWPGSLVIIKIGGAIPGTLHDQLRGTSLRLGGRLRVEFTPGFAPNLGDRFRIVEATSRLRTFRSDYEVVGLSAGLGTRLNYLPDAVELEITNSP